MIDSGRELLDELRAQNVDIRAAAWVQASEDEQWFLYLASPIVDTVGLADAYRRVYSVLGRRLNSWVRMSDIKLIGLSNPTTGDIVAIRARWPGPTAIRYNGRQLGGLVIEGAYIYPVG